MKSLYDMLFKLVLQVVELDVVPDFLLRMGIRWLLGQRYKNLVRWPLCITCGDLITLVQTCDGETRQQRLQAFVDELKNMPVAIQTQSANEQHYEVGPVAECTSGRHHYTHPQVPTEYFLLCLGKHLKYSCCFYPTPTTTLNEAEEAMLGASRAGFSFASRCVGTHTVCTPVSHACRPRAAPLLSRDLCACAAGQQAGHPRAGLRVGLAVPLHGQQVPGLARDGGVQLQDPKAAH